MTKFEFISTFVGVLNVIVVILGVGFAGFQVYLSRKNSDRLVAIHRAELDHAKRVAAQQALAAYRLSVTLSNLQMHFHYIDKIREIPIEEILEALKREPELKVELHDLLNYYEGLARGIAQGIYDEQVIKAGRYGAMRRAYRAFLPYIIYRRAENKSSRAWVDLESIILKWIGEDNTPELRPSKAVGD